jgi:hypothetical protein
MEIPALADLLDLQEVDLEIDRLIERRQSLPELTDYQNANALRVEAEAELDELAGDLRSLDLDVDKAEGELSILESKLAESETRLYAGGMSARETEHKRLEVRSLGGQKEALEERVLDLLDKRDALADTVSAVRARVEAAAADEQRLEAAIKAQWNDIDRELARRETRKAEMIPAIPADLVDTYEKLRQTKQGVAVGRLEDGQCGGRHLHLSAAEQVEAAQSDPPRCVHCRRLLVI